MRLRNPPLQSSDGCMWPSAFQPSVVLQYVVNMSKSCTFVNIMKGQALYWWWGRRHDEPNQSLSSAVRALYLWNTRARICHILLLHFLRCESLGPVCSRVVPLCPLPRPLHCFDSLPHAVKQQVIIRSADSVTTLWLGGLDNCAPPLCLPPPVSSFLSWVGWWGLHSCWQFPIVQMNEYIFKCRTRITSLQRCVHQPQEIRSQSPLLFLTYDTG